MGILLHIAVDMGGKLHNGIDVAYNLIHVCIKELCDITWNILEASVLFQYHKEPQNVSHHTNMKLSP